MKTETTPRYRALWAMVTVRTTNNLGIGTLRGERGGQIYVNVAHGGLLPEDCPVEDIQRLLAKSAIEAVT